MVASNLPDKRLEVTLTLQFPKCQIAGEKSCSPDRKEVDRVEVIVSYKSKLEARKNFYE